MPDAEPRDVRALAESLTGAGISPRQKRIPVGVVAFGVSASSSTLPAVTWEPTEE